MKKILIASLVALLMNNTTLARGLTDAENDALKEAVNNYVIATNANDSLRMFETIPPKIFEAMAKNANMDTKAYRLAAIDFLRNLDQVTQYESFSVDITKAVVQEGTDGEPYVLLPVKDITINEDKERAKKESTMVALLDSGKWYFVRADEAQQLEIIEQAFPALKELEVPKPIIEKLP